MTNRISPTPLVTALLIEAFQTEESARTHCAREADRLGDAAPAIAMRAVSTHAAATLRDLERLAAARGNAEAAGGSAVGRIFSNVREYSTDLLLSQEKSFRGTLLGLHHGRGTMLLLEDLAVASGDQTLADFCGQWLVERTKLVEEAERSLAWFAMNPQVAMARSRPTLLSKLTDRLQGAARAEARRSP